MIWTQWMMVLVLVGWFWISSAARIKDTNIIFERVGEMTTSLNYFHVSIPVNLTNFYRQTGEALKAWHKFSDALENSAQGDEAFKKFAKDQSKEIFFDLRRLRENADDLKSMMSMTTKQQVREYVNDLRPSGGRKKRFLIALLALVGSLFGLMSFAEVSMLNSQVQELNRR